MSLAAQPKDLLGAFMDYPDVAIQHAPAGPLAGLSMGVKDLFDVAGYPTGCGHPDILAKATPATSHAGAVAKLLGAGARFAGKTLTDEIAFSLNGINHHYGAPQNPKAPDRISGGSSSGSVAATAAGVVDFALGTDTGGSIRAPASYCGVFGLRPTHGRIDLSGCMDLAPGFDTLGWFARDLETHRKVGDILFDPDGAVDVGALRPAIVSDVLPILDPGPREVFLETVTRLQAVLGEIATVNLSDGRLDDWYIAARTCQASEIWARHGAWIMRENPVFGPGVRERLEWAKGLSQDEIEAAGRRRTEIGTRIHAATDHHGVLILPTLPGIAPLKSTPIEKIEKFRDRALKVLCLAGISGVPQISLPVAQFDGVPFGISLMGSPGTDEALMDLAEQIETELGTV